MVEFNELRSLAFERPATPLPEGTRDEAISDSETQPAPESSESKNIWARQNHRFKLLIEGIDYLSNQ